MKKSLHLAPSISLSLKVKEENDGIGGEERDPFLVIRISKITCSIKSYNAGDVELMFNLHKFGINSFARSHISSPLVSTPIFSGFDFKHEKKLRSLFGNSSKLSKRLPQVWDDRGTTPMVNIVVVLGDKIGSLPLIRLVEVNVVPIVCNLRKSVIQSLITFVGEKEGSDKLVQKEIEGRVEFLLGKEGKSAGVGGGRGKFKDLLSGVMLGGGES